MPAAVHKLRVERAFQSPLLRCSQPSAQMLFSPKSRMVMFLKSALLRCSQPFSLRFLFT